jgi:hypothetical protein
LKKNEDKRRRKVKRKHASVKAKLSVQRKESIEILFFLFFFFYFLLGLLSLSELGIPKRRKSSSKRVACLFVATETNGTKMH